jgi:predicted nucleic acid-binding protein
MICFFDTNILVYLFDASDPVRQKNAMDCFQEAVNTHTIALSTQVLQEFYAVTTCPGGTHWCWKPHSERKQT